jgi:hypothetical protein
VGATAGALAVGSDASQPASASPAATAEQTRIFLIVSFSAAKPATGSFDYCESR